MNAHPAPKASDLWVTVSKEITGIQLLWDAVNGMYFKAASRPCIEALADDAPILYRLMQTAMMESLLMRIARLMDPAVSGKGEGTKPNLSLARLVTLAESLKGAFEGLKTQWNASALRPVRDKYLSHNDLGRAQSEEHTINIPLTGEGLIAVGKMISDLRGFRAAASQKISGCTYLDASLRLQMERECSVLDRILRAGDALSSPMPDHVFLQKARASTELANSERNKRC